MKETDTQTQNADAVSSTDLLAELWIQHPDIRNLKVVFNWMPTPSEFHRHADLASGYVVIELPDDRGCGIMIYARWDRTRYGEGIKWEPNPWSSRPIIKKLLNLCS